MDTDQLRLSRIEVIDPTGRVYVGYFDAAGANLALQDEGRTLKVFMRGQEIQ